MWHMANWSLIWSIWPVKISVDVLWPLKFCARFEKPCHKRKLSNCKCSIGRNSNGIFFSTEHLVNVSILRINLKTKCEQLNFHRENLKLSTKINCLTCKWSIGRKGNKFFFLSEHLIFGSILKMHLRKLEKLKLLVYEPLYWSLKHQILHPTPGMLSHTRKKYCALKKFHRTKKISDPRDL